MSGSSSFERANLGIRRRENEGKTSRTKAFSAVYLGDDLAAGTAAMDSTGRRDIKQEVVWNLGGKNRSTRHNQRYIPVLTGTFPGKDLRIGKAFGPLSAFIKSQNNILIRI